MLKQFGTCGRGWLTGAALALAIMGDSCVSAQTWHVAADGSAPYATIQQAVDAAPANATFPVEIRIKAGTYRGHVNIPADKKNLALIGENAETTIITDDKNVYAHDSQGQKLSTKASATLAVDADFFSATQLTIANTAGNHGQALALFASGDGTCLRHCRLLGWQDTVRVERGRHYFGECWIEGHCDFIYGNGTAVFERCRIDCLESGYITAASTPPEHAYGLVFLECRITARAAAKRVFLGRPWRQGAQVVYLKCDLPAQIAAEGWDNWRDPSREATSRFGEHRNTGPGADVSKRVKWSRQLADAEAAAVTVENVLQISDAAALRGQGRWPTTSGALVALAGDSTVTDHAGWGLGFAAVLPRGLRCQNFAKGGTSSKSFRDSGLWRNVLNAHPRYVLIQFGHNDMPGKGPERETVPQTTYRANIKACIEESRASGAQPILVTSLTRRHFRGGQIASDLLDYVAEVHKLARECNVPLIDLHAHSIVTCQQLGQDGCNKISPIDPKTGRIDATHLNPEGGMLFGRWVGEQFQHLLPPQP